MNNYIVAKSYQSAERIGEPFTKNNKLYQKIKEKCPRCGGLGIIVARVENNQPIPIPVDQGICYKCAGNKYIYKEVRLYTEKEYNQKEAAAARAKEKKAAELEEKMKREYAEKKAAWMEKNGFNAEGVTYIITGDSYSIKEELKAAGWKFDSVLLWHKADPAGYEDRVQKFYDNELIEYSAWGEGHFKTGAKEYIMQKMLPAELQDLTYVGEIGEKLKKVPVTYTRHNSFCGRYGLTNIYEFKDGDMNHLVWFTAKDIDFEVGDILYLDGTVKEHKDYNGIPQTIVTRCKLSSIS